MKMTSSAVVPSARWAVTVMKPTGDSGGTITRWRNGGA